jgi:hypothetical protein
MAKKKTMFLLRFARETVRTGIWTISGCCIFAILKRLHSSELVELLKDISVRCIFFNITSSIKIFFLSRKLAVFLALAVFSENGYFFWVCSPNALNFKTRIFLISVQRI